MSINKTSVSQCRNFYNNPICNESYKNIFKSIYTCEISRLITLSRKKFIH